MELKHVLIGLGLVGAGAAVGGVIGYKSGYESGTNESFKQMLGVDLKDLEGMSDEECARVLENAFERRARQIEEEKRHFNG